MTNSEVIKAIDNQSVLGFKKAETVLEKIKEAIKTPFRHSETSNGRLIDLLIKTDDGKVRFLLSNYSVKKTFYISQMEVENGREEKK